MCISRVGAPSRCTQRSFDAREHNGQNRGHGTVKVWRMPRSRKSQWTEKYNFTTFKTSRPGPGRGMF